MPLLVKASKISTRVRQGSYAVGGFCAEDLALEPWASLPSSFDLAQQIGTTLHLPAGGQIEMELLALAFDRDQPVVDIHPHGEIAFMKAG